MYLNSTLNPTVWNCIDLSFEKQAKNTDGVVKGMKKEEKILKKGRRLETQNRKIQKLANKKLLEITYNGNEK